MLAIGVVKRSVGLLGNDGCAAGGAGHEKVMELVMEYAIHPSGGAGRLATAYSTMLFIVWYSTLAGTRIKIPILASEKDSNRGLRSENFSPNSSEKHCRGQKLCHFP